MMAVRVSMFLVLLALFAGCRHGTAERELLESELRQQEIKYDELLKDFTSTEAHNEALKRELFAVRQQGPTLTPERALQVYGVRKITLGRGTGGLDEDRVAGDEGLVVVIEPRDPDDQIIKAKGTVVVVALDISPEGLKCPVSTWHVSEDEFNKAYKQALFSTGYQLELKWQLPPRYENVRIVAKFTTLDGRCFEADKDVKVRLLHGAAHRRDPGYNPGGGIVPEFAPAPRVDPDAPPRKQPEEKKGGILPIGYTAASSSGWQPKAGAITAPSATAEVSEVLDGAIQLGLPRRPTPQPE